MNIGEIKELIEFVAQSGVESVTIERSGFRLEIRARSSPATATYSPVVTPSDEAPISAPLASSAAALPAAAPAAAEPHYVTSPIVGTFFRASSPDADPFVKVGDSVASGKVLCIIEAMKLMNEIESDVAGEVLQVFPQNGQPVEFGERLFAIKPA